MFQPRGLRAIGCEPGGWPATGSLDRHAGTVRPTERPRDLAQRNEAGIRLGALSKCSTRLSTTYYLHSHTHTLRVVAIIILI